MSDDMRQLNAEFACDVLGWNADEDGNWWHEGELVADYISGLDFDLAAAWAGVEKLGLDQVQFKRHAGGWYCECYDPNFPGYRTASGPSPAAALCRACLGAVRYSRPDAKREE